MAQNYTTKTASFNKLDFFILSNLVFDNATKMYVKQFDTTLVPYDFITIFIDECSAQNKGNDNYLSKFLLCFNNNSIPFDTICSIFCQSKKPNYTIKKVPRNKLLSGIKKGDYIQTNRASLKESLVYEYESEELKSAYDDLMKIISELNSREKKSSLPQKYKYIKENSKAKKPIKKAVKTPKQAPPLKIEKLILPKIPTNTAYPKSTNLSRVDSRYFAYRFSDPASEYLLIQKYHLKNIVLSDGFLSKRDAVLNSGKSKSKFDDFF